MSFYTFLDILFVAFTLRFFLRNHNKSPLKNRPHHYISLADVPIVTSQCRCRRALWDQSGRSLESIAWFSQWSVTMQWKQWRCLVYGHLLHWPAVGSDRVRVLGFVDKNFEKIHSKISMKLHKTVSNGFVVMYRCAENFNQRKLIQRS